MQARRLGRGCGCHGHGASKILSRLSSGSNETPLVMEKGWAPEANGRLKSDLDKVALVRCAAVCPDTIRAVTKGTYPEKQKRMKSSSHGFYLFILRSSVVLLASSVLFYNSSCELPKREVSVGIYQFV